MTKVCRGAAILAVLAGLTAWLAPSGADEKKEPTIKAIMTKAHKGGDSLIAGIGKDLKESEPDWADVLKSSKELATLGTALGKNEPPLGEKESWEKLTKAYQVKAKALVAAAEKKDKDDATAAHKTLSMTCAGCHKAHKPPSP